jgi:hypothetical protein
VVNVCKAGLNCCAKAIPLSCAYQSFVPFSIVCENYYERMYGPISSADTSALASPPTAA